MNTFSCKIKFGIYKADTCCYSQYDESSWWKKKSFLFTLNNIILCKIIKTKYFSNISPIMPITNVKNRTLPFYPMYFYWIHKNFTKTTEQSNFLRADKDSMTETSHLPYTEQKLSIYTLNNAKIHNVIH